MGAAALGLVAVAVAEVPLADTSLTLELTEAVNEANSLSSEARFEPVAVAMTDWYDEAREAASPVIEATLDVTSDSIDDTLLDPSEAMDEALDAASLAMDSTMEVTSAGMGLVRVTSWACGVLVWCYGRSGGGGQGRTAAREAKAATTVAKRMMAVMDVLEVDGVKRRCKGVGC
jgi:hypothetical protein